MNDLFLESRRRGALYGMHIGDALAMPIHWYYDRKLLQRDNGFVTNYQTPGNPHPDSEMRKHFYTPAGAKDDILGIGSNFGH